MYIVLNKLLVRIVYISMFGNVPQIEAHFIYVPHAPHIVLGIIVQFQV